MTEASGGHRKVLLLDLLVASALLVGGVLLRHRPLGPSSLWLDDAWVALGAVRADGIGEVVISGMTAPGFSVLLSGWLAVTGFSATAAQALPFLLAVVAAPVLYSAVVRLGGPRPVAVVAGAALVVAPLHVDYATRVKQYSLDTLAAVVLLALAWAVVNAPASSRRWIALTATAVVATVASASTVPVVVGAFAAGGIAALRTGRRALPVAVASGAVYAVVAGVWAVTVVRPAVNETLSEFWAGYYVELDEGVRAAVGSLALGLERLLVAVSPLPWGVSAVLVVVGLTWLAARRPLVAVAVVVPLVVAVAMAAVEAAPLGGGRTDHHLFASLALAMGFAVEPLHRLRAPAGWAAAGALVVALGLTASPAAGYPKQDVRPIAAEVDARIGEDDVLLVYRSSIWAYALYTDQPVELVETAEYLRRWGPAFGDDRVHVLGRFRDEPERHRSEVRSVVADLDADASVWLLASHYQDDLGAIETYLDEAGLERVEEHQVEGARLTRWAFPDAG